MKKLTLIIACCFLSSCNPFHGAEAVVSPEGCLLYKKLDDKGNPYYAGTCLNGSHIVQWTQADESTIRVIYTKDDKVIGYIKAKGGDWTRINSESRINTPGFPPFTEGDVPSSGPIT
jgi:hypothetical protein